MTIFTKLPPIPVISGSKTKPAEKTDAVFSVPDISCEEEQAVPAKKDIDVQEQMEIMTGASATPKEPSYTLTDEEAEYYRKTYGEDYDEEKSKHLYDQLAKDGVISRNDANTASGYYLIGSLEYIGGGMYRTKEQYLVKNIMFTDDSKESFKDEWNTFKSQYDREPVTYDDALQEQIDFRVWWKNYALDQPSDNPQPSQETLDKWIESLKRTRAVINQIYG